MSTPWVLKFEATLKFVLNHRVSFIWFFFDEKFLSNWIFFLAAINVQIQMPDLRGLSLMGFWAVLQKKVKIVG
jgi:hypothetical protein